MTLDELQKLCDEATPGPWTVGSDPDPNRQVRYIHTDGFDEICTAFNDLDENCENANFIAAARNYMPLLIDIARAAEVCVVDAFPEEPTVGDVLIDHVIVEMLRRALAALKDAK